VIRGLVIAYLIPLLLVIHVIKTGRSYIWIWVLVLLNTVGALA